ncbi:transcription elongation factor GreA [Pediococcus cellicola]|uniref:Transcription elongation factor GreA n=1 Tax=Pediococcus cellicola TaxID=319652 RepID=A0A0R2IVA6_9LACO|nr:transcription elongation factor GreA [Pediococcus cellicola]KRN65895.1 transcription elongation factor grea [Pediococcus cellicola]GEL15709.1 transcription elongation factor GreA 1 [Pediococcus cellicola]
MSEPYFNKITANGYHQIENEIAAWKAKRPALIKALAEASALGDRSENAEYTSAKRDLRHLESRLHFLTKQLQYSKVVTPTDNQIVEIGKYVTIEFTDDHDQVTYQIVGKQEADIKVNKISLDSPLGSALMGKTVADVATVQAPNATYQVKILAVKL